MNFTPLDIRKKEFKKSMRGFDSEEVEEFLEEISEYVEKLQNDITVLENENKELKNNLENSQSTQPLTEKNDEEIKIDSMKIPNKEAELIIKEAELKALEILEVNRSESHRIKEEIKTLKQQKNSFIKRLKHLFASQIELIEVLEIEDEELNDIKQLSKRIEKNRQSLTGVSKVPAFKRSSNLNAIIDEKQNEIDDIDVKSLKSSSVEIENNMTSIKEKAKEITKSKDSDSNASLDLDNILGDIGEENE